jgi:predicted GNAT family acetyltransferase
MCLMAVFMGISPSSSGFGRGIECVQGAGRVDESGAGVDADRHAQSLGDLLFAGAELARLGGGGRLKVESDIRDNPSMSRFEMSLGDGALAVAYYKVEDSRIVLPHTEVPQELSGRR